MSGSAVIQTALGLALLFALLALLCSAICEFLSSFLQMRARYLLTGLRLMLDHPADQTIPARTAAAMAAKATDTAVTTSAYNSVNALAGNAPHSQEQVAFTGLALAIFGHPLVQSMQLRRPVGWIKALVYKVFRQPAGNVRSPSYLSPQMFSRTLLDALVPDEDGTVSMTALNTTIDALPNDMPAKKSLQTMLKRAEGDLTSFEKQLEDWYDEQMSRVSGWYKRWARVVLVLVGLVIAIGFNLDSLQVSHDLYLDQPLRQAIVTQADTGTLCQSRTTAAAQAACADQELTKLSATGLPIWWSDGCLHGHLDQCLRYDKAGSTTGWTVAGKLVGWGLTAFAVSFGAPFWFQALSRLGSLRSAGPQAPAPASTS